MTASLPQAIIKRAAKLRTADQRTYRHRVALKVMELQAAERTEAGKRAVNADRARRGEGG